MQFLSHSLSIPLYLYLSLPLSLYINYCLWLSKYLLSLLSLMNRVVDKTQTHCMLGCLLLSAHWVQADCSVRVQRVPGCLPSRQSSHLSDAGSKSVRGCRGFSVSWVQDGSLSEDRRGQKKKLNTQHCETLDGKLPYARKCCIERRVFLRDDISNLLPS